MTMNKKIPDNIKIGDKFKTGKHTIAEVIDFYEIKSVTTNEIVGYQCIAKATGLASNEFEVPYSRVIMHNI